MTTTAAPASVQAQALVERLVTFLASGEPPDGLFTSDVFCDFTMPTWRLQAAGVDDVIGLRRGGHPDPGQVTVRRVDPTPTGFIVEFEEDWQNAADRWHCRELIRADVTQGAISEMSVYCTGDWDVARVAEHAAAVRLIRP